MTASVPQARPGLRSRARAAVLLAAAVLATAGCAQDAPAPAGAAPPVVSPTGSEGPRPAAPAPRPRPAEPAAPVRVQLPGIGVSSDLVDLGLAADGSLEVPEDFALAGWFTGGGRPGGRGPVVIAGHVDSRDGPAVFYRLRDLAVGDTAKVTTADGAVVTYRVRAVERHAKDAFPTADVFGATPEDSLRLVTCGGDFDRSRRSYTDNLVVYADATGPASPSPGTPGSDSDHPG